MYDYLLTAALVGVLLFSVVHKARICDGGNPSFFDLENTKAMRGFWCIVVILVHIPSQYQNTIQDMISSFGYIGVTFFFMVSAYGLTTTLKKNPDSVRFFWRKRLPKLLIPMWLINLFVGMIKQLLLEERITFVSIIHINIWVRWLLVAYVVVWLAQLLCKKSSVRDGVVVAVMIAISCVTYVLQEKDIVSEGIWQTELWGVVWGVLLARYSPYFKGVGKGQWFKRCAVSGIVALILGLLYLKFKHVAFWGAYLLKIALGAGITLFILHLNSRAAISNKISSFLGGISYEIYLIHAGIIITMEALFPQMSSGIFILCAVGISIACAYIIHLLSAFLLKKVQRIKWLSGK